MKAANIENGLSEVDPSERVLLLSHCMRPSQTCPGKFNKAGLMCPEDCTEDCVIKRLTEAALAKGYKGTCVAAGGAMALKFVKEHHPRGIVAIACDRELSEGVEGVKELTKEEQELPTIVIIPLIGDGCVDTEVDEGKALEAITLGCSS